MESVHVKLNAHTLQELLPPTFELLAAARGGVLEQEIPRLSAASSWLAAIDRLAHMISIVAVWHTYLYTELASEIGEETVHRIVARAEHAIEEAVDEAVKREAPEEL